MNRHSTQYLEESSDEDEDDVIETSPPKPDRFNTRGSLLMEELHDMSVEQLQVRQLRLHDILPDLVSFYLFNF